MALLYHYCTSEAFYAIMTSGVVRLSSVRHSNDETEGSLLRSSVGRQATLARLPEATTARLQQYASELELQFDGMALCLSEEGDQLTQWRGYANDGRGVAIGLRKAELQELCRKHNESDDEFDLALYKAAYEDDAHDKLTLKLFERLCEFDAQRENSTSSDPLFEVLGKNIAALHRLRLTQEAVDTVYALKHPAFTAEHEWRLLHHFDWTNETPDGFHPTTSRLVPFVNFDLLKRFPHFVAEVALGPLHRTPTEVVERFLRQLGYRSAKVRKSAAPYRRDA